MALAGPPDPGRGIPPRSFSCFGRGHELFSKMWVRAAPDRGSFFSRCAFISFFFCHDLLLSRARPLLVSSATKPSMKGPLARPHIISSDRGTVRVPLFLPLLAPGRARDGRPRVAGPASLRRAPARRSGAELRHCLRLRESLHLPTLLRLSSSPRFRRDALLLLCARGLGRAD